MTDPLRSPLSGAALRPDTPHSLAAAGERWPVLDGIPFLRTGRSGLAAAALERLDGGDRDGALLLLLADQDEWWDGPAPDPAGLRRLCRERDRLSLREAMACLGFGRVADYFAHRWSDPTFLAGLALLEEHWAAPRTAFELACGIGHYLGALAAVGVRAGGGDVVFAKLWLARHWVAPEAELVCFDAASPWPVAGRAFDLVLCHDALYFLEPKGPIVDRLRDLAGARGVLAIGHIHNREADNPSAGAGVTGAEVTALFPDGIVYDDAELTAAAAAGGRPRPERPEALTGAEAFSVVAGPGLGQARPRAARGLSLPPDGTALRRNPLYDAAGRLTWPSARYRDEYGPRATYPARSRMPETASMGPAVLAAARRRELLQLPERW